MEEDQALLASPIPYSATPSSYNYGPRRATDRAWAIAFLAFMGVFWAWGSIGAATIKKNDGSHYAPFWARYDYVDGKGCVANTTGTTGDDQGMAPTEAVEMAIGVSVAVAIAAAFGFGVALLYGFKHYAEQMVWIVVVFKVVAPVAIGLYLFANDSVVLGCVFVVIGLLLALIFWCCKLMLKLVARLFKVSAGALGETMAMVPLQLGFALVTVLAFAGMVVLTASYIAYGQQEVVTNSTTGVSTCEWAFASTATHVYLVFAVFTVYWFMMWALTTRTYVIGDSVSYWYWHGPEAGMLSRAVRHGGITHFGSNAYAGLVLVIIETLKSMARTKSDNIVMCIIKAIITCILDYIEFLCKMSVILIGITGQPFWAAGKQVVGLFTESFGNMHLSTGVWWAPRMVLQFFVLLISAVWGVGTGFAVYLDIKGMSDANCGVNPGEGCGDIAGTYGIAIGVACFVIVFYILAFFANIMESYVDTVFMCYLLDKAKGAITKPEIHEVLDLVLEHQGKKVEATPQFQLQHPPPAYNAQQPVATHA